MTVSLVKRPKVSLVKRPKVSLVKPNYWQRQAERQRLNLNAWRATVGGATVRIRTIES